MVSPVMISTSRKVRPYHTPVDQNTLLKGDCSSHNARAHYPPTERPQGGDATYRERRPRTFRQPTKYARRQPNYEWHQRPAGCAILDE